MTYEEALQHVGQRLQKAKGASKDLMAMKVLAQRTIEMKGMLETGEACQRRLSKLQEHISYKGSITLKDWQASREV